MPVATILVLSDLHFPFQHPAAVDFLADLRRRYKPDTVVGIGDEIDAHRWSTHEQDPELPGPAEELRLAREGLKALYTLFPKVFLCTSNHGVRPSKRAAEAGLPAAFVRALPEVLQSPPGWVWRDTWDIGGVHFRHGDGFSGKNAALTAAEKIRRNVCIGHVHSVAGVQYSAGPFDRIWGLAVGCLINPAHRAFSYGKHMAARPVLGTGVIFGDVPCFVPLPT